MLIRASLNTTTIQNICIEWWRAVRWPRTMNPQKDRKKEVSRRIVRNKEMEHSSQYTTQGHCYPSPTHPRNFRFSCHPFFPHASADSARAHLAMNKTRRIQWKPVPTCNRCFVSSPGVGVWRVWYTCSRQSIQWEYTCNRCRSWYPTMYGLLSKIQLNSKELMRNLRNVHVFNCMNIAVNIISHDIYK